MKKNAASRAKAKERRTQHLEERKERRFEPKTSQIAVATILAIAVGGLALGGGVYGQWLATHRLSYSPWIIAAGAVILAAAILWGELTGSAMRVGDAGIAVERATGAPLRLAWYEIKSVALRDGRAIVESKEHTVNFRVAENPPAAAWLLREAEERIPKKLTVDDATKASLPKTSGNDGQSVAVEPTQVTGRRCRSSDKVITFERDARLCSRCGEIYHADSLPPRCLSCDAEMAQADA